MAYPTPSLPGMGNTAPQPQRGPVSSFDQLPPEFQVAFLRRKGQGLTQHSHESAVDYYNKNVVSNANYTIKTPFNQPTPQVAPQQALSAPQPQQQTIPQPQSSIQPGQAISRGVIPQEQMPPKVNATSGFYGSSPIHSGSGPVGMAPGLGDAEEPWSQAFKRNATEWMDAHNKEMQRQLPQQTHRLATEYTPEAQSQLSETNPLMGAAYWASQYDPTKLISDKYSLSNIAVDRGKRYFSRNVNPITYNKEAHMAEMRPTPSNLYYGLLDQPGKELPNSQNGPWEGKSNIGSELNPEQHEIRKGLMRINMGLPMDESHQNILAQPQMKHYTSDDLGLSAVGRELPEGDYPMTRLLRPSPSLSPGLAPYPGVPNTPRSKTDLDYTKGGQRGFGPAEEYFGPTLGRGGTYNTNNPTGLDASKGPEYGTTVYPWSINPGKNDRYGGEYAEQRNFGQNFLFDKKSAVVEQPTKMTPPDPNKFNNPSHLTDIQYIPDFPTGEFRGATPAPLQQSPPVNLTPPQLLRNDPNVKKRLPGLAGGGQFVAGQDELGQPTPQILGTMPVGGGQFNPKAVVGDGGQPKAVTVSPSSTPWKPIPYDGTDASFQARIADNRVHAGLPQPSTIAPQPVRLPTGDRVGSPIDMAFVNNQELNSQAFNTGMKPQQHQGSITQPLHSLTMAPADREARWQNYLANRDSDTKPGFNMEDEKSLGTRSAAALKRMPHSPKTGLTADQAIIHGNILSKARNEQRNNAYSYAKSGIPGPEARRISMLPYEQQQAELQQVRDVAQRQAEVARITEMLKQLPRSQKGRLLEAIMHNKTLEKTNAADNAGRLAVVGKTTEGQKDIVGLENAGKLAVVGKTTKSEQKIAKNRNKTSIKTAEMDAAPRSEANQVAREGQIASGLQTDKKIVQDQEKLDAELALAQYREVNKPRDDALRLYQAMVPTFKGRDEETKWISDHQIPTEIPLSTFQKPKPATKAPLGTTLPSVSGTTAPSAPVAASTVKLPGMPSSMPPVGATLGGPRISDSEVPTTPEDYKRMLSLYATDRGVDASGKSNVTDEDLIKEILRRHGGTIPPGQPRRLAYEALRSRGMTPEKLLEVYNKQRHWIGSGIGSNIPIDKKTRRGEYGTGWFSNDNMDERAAIGDAAYGLIPGYEDKDFEAERNKYKPAWYEPAWYSGR